jgi:putative copper export protein
VVLAGVLQRGEVVRELSWRVGALVVAAGLLRATGMNAHATQTTDPGWGMAAEFLHLIGVSAWIGGLAMMSICLLPRRDQTELEAVVPGFSRIAMVSVLMILASGAILLWQIIGTVDGFWSTHYAKVLIIKLSIFAVVMLAAMKSRHWVERGLKHAVEAHRASAVRSLSASVATETVLVIAVLAAASVLVTSSPGI